MKGAETNISCKGVWEVDKKIKNSLRTQQKVKKGGFPKNRAQTKEKRGKKELVDEKKHMLERKRRIKVPDTSVQG